MAICSFYQRGACKFGDSCRNEHSGASSGGFANANSNRYAAFGGGSDRYRPAQQSGAAFGSNQNAQPSRFHLDAPSIKSDLTDERPVYPFSCYGPGREAPRQLIEGEKEISPEELRLRYYKARAAGNEATAQQEERTLHEAYQQQLNSILSDLDGAIKYIQDGVDIHPNRIDIAQGKASVGSNSTASATASPPAMNTMGQNQGSAFGQPSNLASAFGQPRLTAFGQPSNPGQTTSAFGQPSNPGQTTSAFGQASNPGQTTSAFGQASAMGGASAFGKPTMPGFGQPSAIGGAGSAFGKPSVPGTTPAFGQPSAFGQASGLGGAQPAFGQPSAPGTTSAFGQPSAPGTTPGFGQANALGQNPGFGKPAFGASAFGQPSQPGAPSAFGQAKPNQPSPFGQQQPQQSAPSPFGQQKPQQNQPSVFGQPSSQPKPSPFGTAAAPQAPAFGQTGFGKPSPSPFGTQNQPQQTTTPNPSPFGTQSQSQSTPAANPFAQKPPEAAKPSPFGQNPPAAAAPSPFGQKPAGTTTALPHPSPFGQAQQKPPVAPSPLAQAVPPQAASAGNFDAKERYKEGKPEEYAGEQGRMLEQLYRRVAQLGRFDDDVDVPTTPPKCEWIVPVA